MCVWCISYMCYIISFPSSKRKQKKAKLKPSSALSFNLDEDEEEDEGDGKLSDLFCCKLIISWTIYVLSCLDCIDDFR